jgi:acetyl esterase/lipase
MKLMPKPVIPSDISLKQIHIDTKDGYHLPIRIYKPASIEKELTVLVWIHGGGFVFGSADMNDTSLFNLVREMGIMIVSVDYRLAPKYAFPTPLEDCYTALEWVFDHAEELGVDPTRIAIGGASAGGGLAACLAQLSCDRVKVIPVFQLLVYPMLDDRTAFKKEIQHELVLTWSNASNYFGWKSYLGDKFGSENTLPYSVAARREYLTGLPPAWIGIGTLDLFYEENIAYAERLKQSGVDCELVVLPGVFHGFDTMHPEIPITKSFQQSQIDALRKYLFLLEK